MDKYRIIETKIPVLSTNTQGIEYKSTYHVEELVTEKFLWMTFKSWIEVQFYRVYGTTDGTRFTSFESAQKHIDFREEPIRRNVVWKN